MILKLSSNLGSMILYHGPEHGLGITVGLET